MILQKIVQERKRAVAALKQTQPIEQLIRAVEQGHRPGACRDLIQAVRQASGLGIIAEIKQASPSKGIIRRDFQPLAIANEYEANNAAGISVLTEPKYFLGKDEYLSEISAAVSLPVLRKDFIVDPYQIYESRLLGADCILLIAAILTDSELAGFQELAGELGLQCLVEVHSQAELERVIKSEPSFIGINNRDLNTFETNLRTTLELALLIPKEIVVVSESGITARKDMLLLEEAGVDGVLIGESLMRASSVSEKLKELRGELGG
jgi:indole-3-glycerol phosphate synthase